jgi:hypothetical protein
MNLTMQTSRRSVARSSTRQSFIVQSLCNFSATLIAKLIIKVLSFEFYETLVGAGVQCTLKISSVLMLDLELRMATTKPYK